MSREKTVPLDLECWVNEPEKELSIVIGESLLVLEEKLRHLASKRLTCRAQWKGKTVIAKFFYGDRFKQHARKESASLKALENAGVNAPVLVYVEESSDIAILIIDYIHESISLQAWLQGKPKDGEFKTMLSEAIGLMTVCHKIGFEVKDPHLDNFLISNDQLYIIDAGGMHQTGSALSKSRAVENMALFFAQFPVTYDGIAYRTLSNNECFKGVDGNTWQSLLIKQRRWRQKKFIDKKVFRECSAYICKENKTRFMMLKRDMFSEELKVALSDPDRLIENGTLLKDGGTATVALVEIAGTKFVLKRYNIKKPLHALIRGLRWSRAAVSWRNGLLLEMLGVPTAKSYAMIEERWGVMRRRSYLLSEYIDAPQAWDVFDDSHFGDVEKEIWAEKIFNLFSLLKRTQISHGDLKAQNILCPSYGPTFIDLDGLKSGQSCNHFYRQFKKDVKRFQISWPSKWVANPFFKKYAELLYIK